MSRSYAKRSVICTLCLFCHGVLLSPISASDSELDGGDPRFRNPKRYFEGRIEEIDSYLMDNMYDLLEERNIGQIRDGLQKIVDDIVYNPEFENYYLDIVDMIARDGVAVIQKERSRLDAVLSSNLEYGAIRDGGDEVRYARVRKNIIDAFVDVLAEATMVQFQTASHLRNRGVVEGGGAQPGKGKDEI